MNALTPTAAALPTLIVITDARGRGTDHVRACLEHLCHRARPRTVLVQLRDRELSAQARIELGHALARVCRDSNQYFTVNDRVDLALLLGTRAVHLGEQSMSPSDARSLLGPGSFISVARHVPLSADPAADAILLSPVVAPRKQRPAIGVANLGALCAAAAPRPVYALGGVTAETTSSCVAAGAQGVAVMGAAFDPPEPTALLASLGLTR